MSNYNVYTKAFKDVFKKALYDALVEIGDIGKASVMAYSGFRGSKLKKATTAKVKSTKLVFQNKKKYATYIENGRGIVKAKNKKALRFKINGKTIFAKWVKGVQPNPFFSNAVKNMIRVGQGIIDKHLNIAFMKSYTNKLKSNI